MFYFECSMAWLLIFAFLSLFINHRIVRIIGPFIGGILGLIPAMYSIMYGDILQISIPSLFLSGHFKIVIDPLAALFLLPIFFIGAICAFFGEKYLESSRGNFSFGLYAFCYNILMMSMAMVVVSQNIIQFLIAWEIMSLSSFALVIYEAAKEESRFAGWLYFSLTHIGTAFIIAFFLILASSSKSFNFDDLTTTKPLLCFVFALIGFGTKAGILPLHIWLPEAHPRAPGHVSALMSGVMIKTGIYGILRAILIIDDVRPEFGTILVFLGILSGVIGVLFALVQHDIKRLLAYHSVENIGIILIGLGLGFVGVSQNQPLLIVMGLMGGLMHVLNHAIFKSLLFLGASSVISRTLTHHIDELGGLLKRMPITAICFLIGAISICGIPPFNGFVSEFLIYFGAFHDVVQLDHAVFTPAIFSILALAVIGGLASFCFTKAFSIIFLGEARHKFNQDIEEVSAMMILPMIVLAVLCVVIGLVPSLAIRLVIPAVSVFVGKTVTELALSPVIDIFDFLSLIYLALITFVVLLLLIKKFVYRHKTVAVRGTWDCGFVSPHASMQYTASSFVDTLANFFSVILRTETEFQFPPKSYFPTKVPILKTETYDTLAKKLYQPIADLTVKFFYKFLRFQHGNVHLYVVYIVVALSTLLIINHFLGQFYV